MSSTAVIPDIAAASIPGTLAALQVNPDTGLAGTQLDILRKEHGYNEVEERKGHPVLQFLGKFWGISAWMLELIMVLSAALGNYADLAVVAALGGLADGWHFFVCLDCVPGCERRPEGRSDPRGYHQIR
jgi:magnesium-transporting ATPase (P-type)